MPEYRTDLSPVPAQAMPMLEVEQPRTYRLFRLVEEEVTPPRPLSDAERQGLMNQQSGYCAHKLQAVSVDRFISFAKLLGPDDQAKLKAVL